MSSLLNIFLPIRGNEVNVGDNCLSLWRSVAAADSNNDAPQFIPCETYMAPQPELGTNTLYLPQTHPQSV